MEDDNMEDVQSHPIFVRAQFPFVFIPTTSTTGFAFNNNPSQTLSTDDQTTDEKEQNEEVEQQIVNDDVDHTETDDNLIEEKNDLRISQPKYSQLLKDLDFSKSRMVDVTNLLPDEGGNNLTTDEKSQNLSSNRSSPLTNEIINEQTSINSSPVEKNVENDFIQEESKTSENKLEREQYISETQKKHFNEEDDDTSKQATQNYDLNEQEDVGSSPRTNKPFRLATQLSNSTQDENLSSIPRLNPTIDEQINWKNLVPEPTFVLFPQPIDEDLITPVKQQETQSLSEEKINYRLRQVSTSSDTDSVVEQTNYRLKQRQNSTSQQHLSSYDDLNQFNSNLKQTSNDHVRPYTTASDILLRRLSNQQNPTRKRFHHRSSSSRHNDEQTANENWISMFEKLELEHQQRLDKQQKQYEEYMKNLEERMKSRLDDYLSTTNSLHDSKSEIFDESIHLRNSNSIDKKFQTSSQSYQYRPLAKELEKQSYSTNLDKRQSMGTNLSRSHSREDISNLRTELSLKHAKHVSDLKLYYEHELDELKSQLNRSRTGNTSSATRQSIETIERINNENIRLHDEVKQLRQSSKINEEENHGLKRQIEELRDQLTEKDIELKNLHRKLMEFEKKFNDTENTHERLNEKLRHADRQTLIYREENEKLSTDLNLTKERLFHLQERFHELENENKKRQQILTNGNSQRFNDDYKYHSTMPLNIPTSREYGHFSSVTSKYSMSKITKSKDENLNVTNGSDEFSPKSCTKVIDYINDSYVSSTRPCYSTKNLSPTRHRSDQMPVRDFIDNQIKHGQQLEEKFDDLLRKKRDLEARINRIPTRGLTSSDRQLLDVLEREIERVEQQISSVKLELRKMNILRTH